MLKYNPLKYFEYEQVNREIKSQILAANPSELPKNPPKESNLVYKINEKINERISEADKHLNIAKELLIVRDNLYPQNADTNKIYNKSLLKRLFIKIFPNSKSKTLNQKLTSYQSRLHYEESSNRSAVEINNIIYKNMLGEIEKRVRNDYAVLKKIQSESKDQKTADMYSDQKIPEILKKIYGENIEILEIISRVVKSQ